MVTVFKKTRFLFKFNSVFLQTTCAIHYFVLKQNKKILIFFPFLAHKKNGTKIRGKAQWSKVLSSAKKQETKNTFFFFFNLLKYICLVFQQQNKFVYK